MAENPPEETIENPPPPPEDTPETPPAPPLEDPPPPTDPQDDADEEAPAAEHIAVDGILGPQTIQRWKEVMKGSPNKTDKLSPAWMKYLQAYLSERVDHRLEIDGKPIKQGSLEFSPTIAALQRYLKTPVNGKITEGRSNTVVALQRRLNEGTF